jgi:hypothetical protein
MAKTPKAPKFQNLPTLEGLAARRRQTISSILADWGVTDADALTARLKREGLALVADASSFFPPAAKPTVPVVRSALVEIPPPPKKEPEPQPLPKKNVELESKKPAKAKLTSDAADAGPEDRAPSKPAVVVPSEAGEPKSKA